jgi:hypothetical protein
MKVELLKRIRSLSGVGGSSGTARSRLLGVGVVAAAVLFTSVAVGASPVGISPLTEVLGANDHGKAVSEAVQEAKESLEEGEKLGPAVSEAACTAAHDRTTLPDGAQNAPGQAEREPKDCTHPSNASDEEADGEDAAAAEDAEAEDTEDEATNHGKSVSDAVHAAKDDLEDGEKTGPAVSEAACTAAHDRTTLPESAQNAPGQADREPKDCTHPSNVEDEEEGTTEDATEGPGAQGKEKAQGHKKDGP